MTDNLSRYKAGYKQALADLEERLDNAVDNHAGPEACWHYDFELRDQLIELRGKAGIPEEDDD